MWPRLIIKHSFFFLIGFALVGIISIPGALAGPDYGGSLRMANEVDSFGFDVLKARGFNSTAQTVGNLVMERLFELDQNKKLIPVLGLSAAPSGDRKIWTVKLRQGVKFHDGTSFNADAVVAHWKRILNPENRFRGLVLIHPLKAVEKVDTYTVKFVLKHAWEPFLSMVLANKRMAVSLIPSSKAVKDDIQNRSPVGTGPFVFKEWKTGDRIVAARNPDYRLAGRPYLDEIIIRYIPDHNARYMALQSGQVDLIITDRPSHVKKLMQDPGYATAIINPGGTGILMMNNTKPPLDDIRVRRALAYAWDQAQYIKAVYHDIIDSTEYLNTDMLRCDDYGYLRPDVKKARELMASYGKPVELEYLHSQTQRGRETAMVMQQHFKKIGVTIKPAPLAWGGIAKRVFGGEYDLTSWVIPGFDDMGPIIMASFSSKSPWNLTRYDNQAVDELFLKQRMSIKPDVRRQALCEAARKINADVPFLYLFKQRYYMVSKKNVKGILPPQNEYIRLEEAWIKK